MTFVFGGAYQGKKAFVVKQLGICEQQICDLTVQNQIDWNQPVLYGYEQLVLAQIRDGVDPFIWLTQNLSLMADKIVVSEDMSCGVVPISAEERRWLRELGRCLQRIAFESESVYRLFCGIATSIK